MSVLAPAAASRRSSTFAAADTATLQVDQVPAQIELTPGSDTGRALGTTIQLSSQVQDANGHVVAGAAPITCSVNAAPGAAATIDVDAHGLVAILDWGTGGIFAKSGSITEEVRFWAARSSPPTGWTSMSRSPCRMTCRRSSRSACATCGRPACHAPTSLPTCLAVEISPLGPPMGFEPLSRPVAALNPQPIRGRSGMNRRLRVSKNRKADQTAIDQVATETTRSANVEAEREGN